MIKNDIKKKQMRELKKISDKIVSLLEENGLATEEMKVVLGLAEIEFEFISEIDPTRI